MLADILHGPRSFRLHELRLAMSPNGWFACCSSQWPAEVRTAGVPCAQRVAVRNTTCGEKYFSSQVFSGSYELINLINVFDVSIQDCTVFPRPSSDSNATGGCHCVAQRALERHPHFLLSQRCFESCIYCAYGSVRAYLLSSVSGVSSIRYGAGGV